MPDYENGREKKALETVLKDHFAAHQLARVDYGRGQDGYMVSLPHAQDGRSAGAVYFKRREDGSFLVKMELHDWIIKELKRAGIEVR